MTHNKKESGVDLQKVALEIKPEDTMLGVVEQTSVEFLRFLDLVVKIGVNNDAGSLGAENGQ